MKKLIALLLAAIMCLSLCACGKDAEDSQGGKNDGGSSSSASKEPTVKEEKEFVICREWRNVKSGNSVVFKEDGNYTSGDSTFSYTYSAEKNAVWLDGTKFDIVQQYGVYMLVFNEDEYLVGADNYEAVHAIFVKNGREEIAASGTIVKVGDTNRLKCGAYFTLDKVELDKENTIFYVYLTCKNGNDEGCTEFGSVKGNWTSLNLGCPFELSTENAYVDAQYPTREICLAFQTTRLTADEIQTRSADSYGYFRLYFSAGKEAFYIDIDQFFDAK